MKVGFIGTGSIAEAVIQGLCTCAQPPDHIWVSPRNQKRAQRLASTYARVTVAERNQDVVDHSDWIFITVKPDTAVQVLSELRFREGQQVVNCVSTLKLEQAQTLIDAPVGLFKAIPLTPIALHLGPVAFTPPDAELRALFDRVGTAVEAENETALRALAAATAQIASFYALQATTQAWLEKNGIAAKEAKAYVSSMYHALATLAASPQAPSFDALLNEAATPEGLNEQALSQLNAAHWLGHFESSLDAVQARLIDS
jgi:pyrroline-5-carboxylate reductase